MHRRIAGWILPAILCVVLAGLLPGPAARADEAIPKGYRNILQYAVDNQPMELDLGKVELRPWQLLEIKKSLPEGAVLKFSIDWAGMQLDWDSTEINLNKAPNRYVSDSELNAVLELVPTIRKVVSDKMKSLSNNRVIPLLEKYPDIEFVWLIKLYGEKYIPSNATAYSMKNVGEPPVRLRSKDLAPLKYAKNLKALDLGHNTITDLEWLRDFPDLELLILADNKISDISVIGELKHLKYLEIFMNYVTDLSPLVNCQELLDLNISVNDITDISVLYEIPSLERLWANVTKLTREQIAEFGEKRPEVATYFTDWQSTGYGWRKHPRYDHYIWCFNHQTWIPFDEPLPEE